MKFVTSVCVCLLTMALGVSVAGAGVVLQPEWEQGQRLRFATLARTQITTDFDGHAEPTVMNTVMRSELLWDIIETPEGGGAVIDVWWDWVRIEMESSSLVEPVVFDSRESDQAKGLVAQTFGPLTKMIGQRVRLAIDDNAGVALVRAVESKEAIEGTLAFDQLAGKAFGDEAVRYMVRSLLMWTHPGEVEPGDSWAVVLPSRQRATCTFDEIREIDGEKMAILRAAWALETDHKPSDVGASGERVEVEHQIETFVYAVSIDRGMIMREESSLKVATKIRTSEMEIESTQQMTSVTTFVGQGSIDDEHELDLDRHAEGE